MNPAAVLTQHLAEARRQGEVFAHAWPGAVGAALASTPNESERNEWAAVFGGMVATWRAAFDREPTTRTEAAMLRLADPDRVPLPAHPCEHCEEEISPARVRRHARWCSDRCRQAAKTPDLQLVAV
jgi:hypothetical protein